MEFVRVTEAVYAGGVLRPMESLSLRENERVRLIVQSLNGNGRADPAQAMERLLARAKRLGVRSTDPYPTRDELHERG